MEFSVVEFATQAFITSGLTDDVAAKAAVNGIAYSGGFTNKRSTSPRDEARSPHLDARKKIKQKHRTKFRVQFLSPGWRRLLTVDKLPSGTTISMYTKYSSFFLPC